MTAPADALVRLALHAALADGTLSNAERQLVGGFVAGIPGPRPDLAAIEAGLHARRCAVADLVQPIVSPEDRRAAFEMCAAICAADGPPSAAEQWFLDELRHALALDPVLVEDTHRQVVDVQASAVPAPSAPAPVAAVPPVAPPAAAVDAAALDRTILNHALVAGGLELLPDTLAAMAIIPVQMKLVYQVGKAHGVELDRGHVQEFLGVVGIGVASQVLERYAVRMVKGVAGRFLGGLAGGLLGQATGSTMAFATTYALGQAARQYYAGGRRRAAVELKELFAGLLPQARQLQERYAPQIRSRGDSLRGTDLASLARGL